MHSQWDYMQQTLALADAVQKPVSPNPKVGCVIVKNNQVVGRGYHQGPGTAHAEIVALQQAGAQAAGADLYVNLEPCCHFGRTAPCTDSIIKAGIKRVYCAMQDPNPLVRGQGISLLQNAGIDVIVGIGAEQAQTKNRFFSHFIKTGFPYVIAKWAMSCDGRIKVAQGDTRFISHQASQFHCHQTRREVDAILIGVNTAIADDPTLTVRFVENPTGYQPLRIVLDSQGRLPLQSKIVSGELPGTTMIATTQQSKPHWRAELKAQGNCIVVLPEDTQQQVGLLELLHYLGSQSVTSLLVEGGEIVLSSFINQGLVNEVQGYVGANLIAGLPQKQPVTFVEHRALGDDVFFRGVINTMYTGLVQGLGTVKSVQEFGKSKHIAIDAKIDLSKAGVGDSIAVNGTCLTITTRDKSTFTADVVHETLNKTNLGFLSQGSQVNLELTATMGSHIGGHIVKGHVDTVGEITDIKADGVAQWITVAFPSEYSGLLVPKGSIALDGMSLTVVDVGADWFTVTLIPHTLSVTIAQHYSVGSKVNLEFDILAKHVQKLWGPYHEQFSAAR